MRALNRSESIESRSDTNEHEWKISAYEAVKETAERCVEDERKTSIKGHSTVFGAIWSADRAQPFDRGPAAFSTHLSPLN
jgi:hypothetical protein